MDAEESLKPARLDSIVEVSRQPGGPKRFALLKHFRDAVSEAVDERADERNAVPMPIKRDEKRAVHDPDRPIAIVGGQELDVFVLLVHESRAADIEAPALASSRLPKRHNDGAH